MKLISLAIGVLAACGAPSDPCATAGDGTRAVWAAESWSAEAIACVREGTQSCNDVLTPEQRKGLMGADRP
jgi:hypothetical protein